MNFKEYKQVDYAQIADEILAFWQKENIFEKSVTSREGKPSFTFYEGPPSANGTPGIHHVMARAIKDIFCRYQTLKGKQVHRKGGWDTHGLPVELQVEKELGITKEDIGNGKKDKFGNEITVEYYNQKCRETVMRFTDQWQEMTDKMGYWVDMEKPYVTYENNYIESVWYLLKELYKKGLLYKGYTIQPYSPAAGTGLSSHELNMPGTYQDVKDTSITAQFKVTKNDKSEFLFTNESWGAFYILAWTTTPWTLPSNSALTIGKNIDYAIVKTFNPYTFLPINVILANNLVGKHFNENGKDGDFEAYKGGDKIIPWSIINTYKGASLEGIEYEQLMPYVQPETAAFRVIIGDFVTTEDGTGVVHTAPTFGADDFKVAQQHGIPSIMVKDANGKDVPLVDLQGKFVKEVKDFALEYVKEAYLTDEEKEIEKKKQGRDKYLSVDERIAIKLKTENKAFNVQRYEHTYPHCWRTDKPILYYPLDSWFIKTTAVKDKLVGLNKNINWGNKDKEVIPINWKPESTGTGRFGNWLENLVDWNLSRSRYWGTPLPIWQPALELKAVGSEINKFHKVVGALNDLNDTRFKYLSAENLNNFINSAKEIIDNNKETEGELNFNQDSNAFLLKDLRKWRDEKFSLNNFRSFCFYSGGNEFVEFFLKFTENATNFLKKKDFDLHRPYIDNIYFVGKTSDLISEFSVENNNATIIFPDNYSINNDNGTARKYLVFTRETDLIDVWFDSGAMPYAQWHYPFENKDIFERAYPADFISEGVDQTRGWFFTLHAISGMVSDSVAFKNVVSTGLVLDKNGNKMSKRLGNAVDPFETLKKYGADPTRWYMITNSQPWDNLKFDLAGITEVRNKFFGTLTNTYNFFALYANLDNYSINEFNRVPYEKLTEMDRWILSKLLTLVKEVDEAYSEYEPTKAGRAIQEFVNDHLSNWYVRLCRRRFWQGEITIDKNAAYETLQHCLLAVAQLMAPIAPFYSDWLYKNMTDHIREFAIEKNTPLAAESVHLSDFHPFEKEFVDENLEESMDLAQRICSLVHSIRKANRIKVRQPLSKVLIPVLNEKARNQIRSIENIIKTEVNIKEIEYLSDSSGVLSKKVRPNFKTLGPHFGKDMKIVASAIQEMSASDLTTLENTGEFHILNTDGSASQFKIHIDDVEIITEDLPGFISAKENDLIVALDIEISPILKQEGIARDFVNRVQNFRKDTGFDVVDKIKITLLNNNQEIVEAVIAFKEYISAEVQAKSIELVDTLTESIDLEMEEVILKWNIEVV